MTFYNYDLKLIEYVINILQKITKKTVNICQRKEGDKTEYCINFPSEITHKLIELGFSKSKLPAWLMESRFGINFLKAFYECEGSLNGNQIMIYQSDEKILKYCVKIANKFGLSAHVHRSTLSRERDFYLAIENLDAVKNKFKPVNKLPKFTKPNKGRYYSTKREVLRILNGKEQLTTTEILFELKNRGLKMKKESNSLLNNHLKPLCEKGVLSRKTGYQFRGERGMFSGVESKWKLEKNFTEAQIINYPYCEE